MSVSGSLSNENFCCSWKLYLYLSNSAVFDYIFNSREIHMSKLQIVKADSREKKAFLSKFEKISEELWERELYNRPFLLELFDGRLPREKFRQYLIQDYHYLGRFAQAMAMATAKASDLFTIRTFGTHLKISLELEFPRVWKMMT